MEARSPSPVDPLSRRTTSLIGHFKMTSQVTSRRKSKYSGSQLGLFPAFTVLANDWRFGESYLDTAARQLRVLTGFHAFPWLIGGKLAARRAGGKVKLRSPIA